MFLFVCVCVCGLLILSMISICFASFLCLLSSRSVNKPPNIYNVTSFEENLKELQPTVLESKWGKMRADLAHKLLEEQDTVFRRYYEAKCGNGDGGSGGASAGRQEHVGCDVYIVIGKE